MAINATIYMNQKETNSRSDMHTIIELLDKLKKSKKLDYRMIDTSKLTDSQRMDAYGKVIGPSVFNKYEVRRVFGTNRQSGIFFGKEQPALLVEGDIWDIFPHRKNGKEITIVKFLENLMRTLE